VNKDNNTIQTLFRNSLTTKPWSFMLRMKFWPITARPMRAMSALQMKEEEDEGTGSECCWSRPR
jgi:hypothetical protein